MFDGRSVDKDLVMAAQRFRQKQAAAGCCPARGYPVRAVYTPSHWAASLGSWASGARRMVQCGSDSRNVRP